jgi:hypothetical protein
MYSDEDEMLTAEERALLTSLPREMAPSDMLEERVVRALRKDGHLGSAARPRNERLMSVLRIAAAIALFAGGVAAGRYLIAPDVPASASVQQPARSRVTDTLTPKSRTTPATETIVAEREMWM